MDFPAQIKQQTCMDCLSGKSLGFEIRMAFQPIIHWPSREIHGYEALVRGPNGEALDGCLSGLTKATNTISIRPAELKR